MATFFITFCFFLLTSAVACETLGLGDFSMFDTQDRVQVERTMETVQTLVNELSRIVESECAGNTQVLSTTITTSQTGDIRISQRIQKTVYLSRR